MLPLVHLARLWLPIFAALSWPQNAIEIIKGTSPVAWQNVNLIGKFEFTEEKAKVDIDALAARYNDPDFWRKSVEGDSDL